MEKSQPIYNQLNKNIDLLKVKLQNQIQIERQALRQEFHNLYGTKISLQQQQIDAIKSEIQEKLDTVKKEVDALQIGVMQPKAWYRDASVIIALLAVLFSLSTAMASYFQVDSQNKRAARVELRELIQRLIALPREDMENKDEYKNNPDILSILSSGVNQEYTLLAGQAAELANRIPDDISLVEYVSIAQALMNRGIKDHRVLALFEAGQEASKRDNTLKDDNSELVLLRNYGKYYFMIDDIKAGREKYQDAMNFFSTRSADGSVDENFIELSHARTEVHWAESESRLGECKEVENLLTSASNRIAGLFRDDDKDTLIRKVEFVQDYMENNSRTCKP